MNLLSVLTSSINKFSSFIKIIQTPSKAFSLPTLENTRKTLYDMKDTDSQYLLTEQRCQTTYKSFQVRSLVFSSCQQGFSLMHCYAC